MLFESGERGGAHELQKNSRELIAGLHDDGNRLAVVRGIMIGTILGIIVWAVILWGLL